MTPTDLHTALHREREAWLRLADCCAQDVAAAVASRSPGRTAGAVIALHQAVRATDEALTAQEAR